jgi:hypothetical protein
VVNTVSRRWLCNAPRLMAGYLVWVNRGRGSTQGCLLLVVGLILVWAIIAALLFRAEPEASASALAWMYRHQLFLAGLATCVAGVLVSRRRALKRTQAVRSWLAALPVRPGIARWERLVIETAPALGAIFITAAAFGTVSRMVVFAATISPIKPASTWFTITAGIVAGASISYLLPVPKVTELPPGSRYVPHRRVMGVASPSPSLSALGRWPIRQMFASARPKAVVRAVTPILLLIPLGSGADAAMLIIAVFAVLGAVLLLVLATISVSKASCRWLQPLPLKAALLARHLLIQPLAVIVVATLVVAWLLWVMGSPPAQSLKRGILLMILSSSIAVVGSAAALYQTSRGRR